ncbi:hypothetical protein [Ruegeria arenilitoris]|uniref:hypothetical protein n=1 Tax=Ruegeria arenilitoris TaxID=1173585 RepID=UPI00147EBC37|nr:hypothetical protein [Ruegeria arenilitoris]
MYKQLEAEGRLLSDDWGDYDGSHAVFLPKQMTPEELEYGADAIDRRFISTGRCLSRTARQIGDFGLSTAMQIQS